MVRDLSAELGKQVLLEIDGGDVELDREMIEMIRDPLTHIVRNAIDHGIEPPAERAEGRQARDRHAARLRAPVGQPDPDRDPDDGRGIDGEKLVEKAIAQQRHHEQQAERCAAAQKQPP
jgi:two-component system chemotaxis sensor kinase CheA